MLYTGFIVTNRGSPARNSRKLPVTLTAVVLGITVFIVSVSVCADIVKFADPHLEAAVRQQIELHLHPYQKPPGWEILESDLVGLTSLGASWRVISNLAGIEYCVNLKYLNLEYNQIVDLTTLAGLTKLTELRLDENQIVDLTPLAGLTKLTELRLDENQIVDLTPLSGLTNLKYLYVGFNEIVDLTPLSGLTELTELWLERNEIVDFTPLSGLTNLRRLFLYYSQIADLTTLSGLTNLKYLDLEDNLIVDITPLSGLTNLKYLDLGYNQIVDMTPLSGLTNLGGLYLNSNQIADLTSLSGLTELMELSLRDNLIVDIAPLAGLTNLTNLRLDNNQIVDIDPLVANSVAGGLGEGNDVNLQYNYLDLTPGSADMADIQALIDRGVDIVYEPQYSLDNNPPIANAGPDQTVTDTDVNREENVTLDGGDSYDPDGSIASWVWTEGGSQIATGRTPTVTLSVSTHVVTLTVTDDRGNTGNDQVTITVTPVGEAQVTITGCVTDANTMKGIAGVQLCLHPDSLGYCPSTDASGSFSFSIPPGTYEITTTKDGYISVSETNVTVNPGQTTTINFALTSTKEEVFQHADRVRTTVFGLRVREDPNQHAPIRDSMYKGNSGLIKSGPVTSSDGLVWWEIGYNIGVSGWSAQATEMGKTCLEPIPDSPSPPQGFGSWAESAINWAQAITEEYGEKKHWYDSDKEIGYCAKFAANAFMITDATSWDCPNAEDAGGNADDLFQELDRWNQEQGGWENAPIGSLIFFGRTESNGYGHVAIYIAHDRIIHAHGRVREQSLTDLLQRAGSAGYEGIGPYIGWSYPPERWRPKSPSSVAIINLRKKNSLMSIDTISVNSAFDIYLEGPTGNLDQVRFSSDDDQDHLATGGWTEWVNWDSSSGDWDADTKCMSWTFTTPGEKEICAEIKNSTGSLKCFAEISAVPIWRRFIQPGDILYDPCALGGVGHVGIYIGNGQTVDPREDGLVHAITSWDWPARSAAQILRVDCPDTSANCAQAAADWASDLVDQIERDPNRFYCYQCPLPCEDLCNCFCSTYCTASCTKNASQQEDDWYCSELVWAAYFNQKVNIENDRDAGRWWWITHSWEELKYIDPIRPHEICDDNYDVGPVGGHDHGEFIILSRKLCNCRDRLEIRADCPVDLLITDPDGLTIDKDSSEILNGIYWFDDLNGDNSLDVIVSLEPKQGTYQIQVKPRPEAGATDTYTLVFEDYSTSKKTTVADEVSVKDIPDEPYQFELPSSESGADINQDSDGLFDPTTHPGNELTSEHLGHTITATAGSHGAIDPAGYVTVTGGADKTFAITPNTGYVMLGLWVDGEPAEMSDFYTFANVSADHTIHATFTREGLPEKREQSIWWWLAAGGVMLLLSGVVLIHLRHRYK